MASTAFAPGSHNHHVARKPAIALARQHWRLVVTGWIARALVIIVLIPALIGSATRPALADHESTSSVVFAQVGSSRSPGAMGDGVIEFHGGAEPRSRWTVSFTFTGLQPNAAYTVVDQGRFGEDGSPEATAFTPLCVFDADSTGAGGCWDYLFGLRRANVIQLRLVSNESPVLQATREPGGPGAITSVPNRFSPPPRLSGSAAGRIAGRWLTASRGDEGRSPPLNSRRVNPIPPDRFMR